MPKYGLTTEADLPSGHPSYAELQEYGYDPKSAQKAGLEGAGKGAAAGATIGGTVSLGSPLGIAAGFAIGAGLGYVGGFAYDMISGGDNLSEALDLYKIQKDKDKLVQQTAKEELRAQKSQIGRKGREKKGLPVPEYDEVADDIMAMGRGASQYDRYMQQQYGEA